LDPKNPPQGGEPAPLDPAAEERRRKELAKIFVEEDRRLRKCFDAPDFAERIEAMFKACGRVKKRSIAGPTF
jgi:hypothetical protein